MAYWSNHNNCSVEKMRAESLQGKRERIHCDLKRIYRDMRNIPTDTCLNIEECDEQRDRDDGYGVKEKFDDDMCGCYRKGNRYFWNSWCV